MDGPEQNSVETESVADPEMGIDFRDCGGENLEPLLRNSSERRSRARLPTSPSAASLAAVAEQIARNDADRRIPKIRIPSYASGLNTLSTGEPADSVYGHTISEGFDPGRTFNLAIPESKTSAGSTPGSTPSPLPNMNIVGPVCRWRRSDRRLRRLNTELLDAIEIKNFKWAEKSLKSGACPNATCRLDYVSACHLAAIGGSDDILAMLIDRGAERVRPDRLGRTPLHLAAWGGHQKCVAILLQFPETLQKEVAGDLSKQVEERVRSCCKQLQNDVVNVRCKTIQGKIQLPKEWKDSFDHDCKDIKDTIPLIGEGWTPLHVAAARARPFSTRLLLVAGADVHALDDCGRTPLDVLGASHYHDPEQLTAEEFVEVLKMLLEAGASQQTMRPGCMGDPATPLHTAVELDSSDAVRELLGAGAYPGAYDETGDTPLHTCVRRHYDEPLQILVNTWSTHVDPFPQTADLKNRSGYTVLQVAVTEEWIAGVCVALEAGADVSAQANDGETAIHAAAALGNLDLLLEILSVAKRREALDCQNASGETALFKAIAHGHVECVRALMSEGASVTKTMPGEVTAIHRAAEFGYPDILYDLLTADKKNPNGSTIDFLCDETQQGFGAIHYAAYNDHADCVQLLLTNGANVRHRTTPRPHGEMTALHIASMLGHTEVMNVILAFDKYTVHEVDSRGWLPIHTAGHHGSRDAIPFLLQAGSDLSSLNGIGGGPNKTKRTAIDMLVNNMTRPADYLEDLFDSYISVNGLGLQDSNCEVHVDYSVLMPKNCETEQMKVIVALLKTGNRYDQRRLLLHPLVESFLYLKWKALSPFFYFILACYAIFVSALTCLIISIFYYHDIGITPPSALNKEVWAYIMITFVVIIVFQEMLYLTQNTDGYFLKLETWVKFGSVSLSAALPFIEPFTASYEWPRHVATLAVLLSWTELMFLLSRFPNWGYYVLMFSKVAGNVIKILLTFAFLVIGFSLSFMIQFRSQVPFDGPWAALVKTIVMMTSEFDYVALFDDEHTKDLANSLLVGRIVFVAFLILAAIVLMNLMVGVAVSDINDLEILGNIQRLAKQVEFLGTLDVLVYNQFFSKVLPRKLNASIRGKRNVANKLVIYPGRPRWKHEKFIPTKIKDAIFLKATKQKMINDEALALKNFSKLIDEIHEATVNRVRTHPQHPRAPSEAPDLVRHQVGEEFRTKHQKRHEEIINLINTVSAELAVTKESVHEHTQGSRSPLKDINRKLDMMHKEIDYLGTTVKRVLGKVEALATAQGLPSPADPHSPIWGRPGALPPGSPDALQPK